MNEKKTLLNPDQIWFIDTMYNCSELLLWLPKPFNDILENHYVSRFARTGIVDRFELNHIRSIYVKNVLKL